MADVNRAGWNSTSNKTDEYPVWLAEQEAKAKRGASRGKKRQQVLRFEKFIATAEVAHGGVNRK